MALAGSGCGAEERPNDPRPPAPTRVSVTITEDSITVQPPRIAFGPEPTQRLPQNQHTKQPQARSGTPLTVILISANLTDFDSRLELEGPKEASSGKLVANGTTTMEVDLPTGAYEVTAADIPGAKTAELVVGPYRVSSANDLLGP